ncbi:MAG: PEP-CTERM sorting domain-containing protein [Phycisphaeraceae bacterium]|nr:PEP-CTERM sorting domain-containing protein [Phycisphaeraceae bacterium]
MRRFHAMLVAGVIGAFVVGLDAPASLIDYRLAAGGAPGPFSDRVQDTPLPWAQLNHPLDAGMRSQTPWRFSEQGLGNSILIDYGQISYIGDLGTRARRAIYDVLAWVPVPQLLYLDPHRPAPDNPVVLPGAFPRHGDIRGPARLSESGGRSLSLPPVEPPVPEPATIILFSLSFAALFVGRRVPASSRR